MKVVAYFGNPFFILLYTAALLAMGWMIGVRWGIRYPRTGCYFSQ